MIFMIPIVLKKKKKKEKKDSENQRVWVFTLILVKLALSNDLQKYKRGSNSIPDHRVVLPQYF